MGKNGWKKIKEKKWWVKKRENTKVLQGNANISWEQVKIFLFVTHFFFLPICFFLSHVHLETSNALLLRISYCCCVTHKHYIWHYFKIFFNHLEVAQVNCRVSLVSISRRYNLVLFILLILSVWQSFESIIFWDLLVKLSAICATVTVLLSQTVIFNIKVSRR